MSATEVAEYVEAVREPARAGAGERLMHEFAYRELVPTLLGRNRSRRLTVPTLTVDGIRNQARTAGTLRGYEPYADAFSVRLIHGAGHWLPEQCPTVVADAVRAVARTGCV